MNGNDQILDKSAPAMWHIIRVLGILLILWSLFSLFMAYSKVGVPSAVDVYPCAPRSEDLSHDLRFKDTPMPSDTRIVYCLHSTHYSVYGFTIYDSGTTQLNEVMVGEVKLKRQEETLFVNNQPLQIGERYDVVRQNPSYNPWLRFTTHFVVVNSGLYLPASSMPGNSALYVTGDVTEDWHANPLGAIILFGGIGLVILGSWGINRTKIAREKPAMQPPVPLNIKARDIAVGFFGWIIFSSLLFPLLYLLYLLYSLMSLGYVDLDDNLFIIWLPAIITTLIFYRMKRFSICAGIVLAVAINSGIWMSVLPGLNVTFFDALLLSGIPLPPVLLFLLVVGYF